MTQQRRGLDHDQPDHLLEDALRALGRSTGGRGAGLGAWIAARVLKTRHHETRVVCRVPPREILRTATELLGGPGNLVSGDSRRVTGIVGAGHGDLNPALVCVAARALENGETEVVVLAAAKEGLVKQHSAEKAVERMLLGLGLRK